MRVIWRTLMVVLGLGLRVPAVVLAVWGGTYAVRCAQSLSAPGVPIEYRYESSAGTMLLRAESYLFDLEAREGLIQRVRLFGPSGEQIASADAIDFALEGDVAIVRVNDPALKVRRLADGSFDVARMLPLQYDEEKTEGAFRFVARRASVTYSDASVARPPLQIELRHALADGSRGTFLFATEVDFDGVETKVAGSYSDTGRLRADVQLEDCDVAHLLPYVSPVLDTDVLGEFTRVDAESLVLDGDVQLWHDPSVGASLSGSLAVTGRGLRSKETLRGASVSAKLTSDGRNVNVIGSASQGGLSCTFDGTIRQTDAFRMTGRLSARAESRASLPPILERIVGTDVEFANAVFDGSMDTDGNKFLFDGDASVERASFGGETTQLVAGRVRFDQDRVVARLDEGQWCGLAYSGAIAVEFSTGELSGGFQSTRGRLEPIAKYFGTDRLKGIVSANAVLRGTIAAPVLEAYARGSGGVQIGDGPLASLGVFEMRGRVDADGLFLDRLTSNGQNGVVTAQGSMKWASRALDLKMNAGGLDLAGASDHLKGLGFINATLGGTLDAPRGTGRVEVYGFEARGRSAPQIVAELSTDGERVLFDRVSAHVSTGRVEGSGSIKWSDGSLDGRFSGSGLRLEEVLAPWAVGSMSVNDGEVGGTLSDPKVSGTLTAGPVFAGGVEVESSELQFVVDRRGASSPLITMRLGGGELRGTGMFDFGDMGGSLAARFADIPLSKAPLSEHSLAMEGTASGELSVTFDDQGVTRAEATADLEALSVNGTLVGQGWVQGALDGGRVTADAQVGSLDRYLLLTGGGFDPDSKTVTGEVLAYNLRLEDIADAAKRAIADWPSDLSDLILNTRGLFNAGVTISGLVDDPAVSVDTLVLSELDVRGRDAGVLRAKGAREKGVWTIQPQTDQPLWFQGDTKFRVDGTVSESGAISLNGELNNFQLAWLHTLFPRVQLVTGDVNKFAFDVGGRFDDPSGLATLETDGLGYYEGERAVRLPLSASFDSIEVAGRTITMNGYVDYQALQGRVTGSVPFSSLYDDTAGRSPLSVSIALVEGPFSAFAPYLTALDAARSKGTVSGGASVSGLWGDLKVEADLSARGEALALTGQDSFFKDVDLSAKWDNGTATLAGKFSGEKGGSGSLGLRVAFPDLFAEGVSLDEIKRLTTLDGGAKLDGMRAQFTLPLAERASGATVTTDDLTVAGTVASPRISGRVALSDVYVRMPSKLEENDAPVIYSIDPVFDGLALTVAQGSRIDAGTARIDFFGSGRLAGSLQNPDVSLPLTVTGGVYEMPTARIAIESGGTLIVGYRSALSSAPTARVDLDLEGRTIVSARRVDNQYETYQVTIGIRGNLLDRSGLLIEASSDPPDLSSDQILAILGRKDLIEGFARGGSDTDLRGTLYTVGLPTAASLMTSGLARELRLDYISLDYNPFDQAVAGIGKSVGDGLMFYGTRQLAANPGERLKYEVQLTYRLPLDEGFFSRLRLSLGLDQGVPWRLRLNWAKRF